MHLVSDRTSNPLGLSFPCERAVPGYGDPAADFHVVGDHPGVHGGLEHGIPFTERPWSERFFATLHRAGLCRRTDDPAERYDLESTFLSYLHACEPVEDTPTPAEYEALEPSFDAELRAITAHVLVPVGERATTHVLGEYTAKDDLAATDLAPRHATEVRGAGWLVVPCLDPSDWDGTAADALVAGLRSIRGRDFRQIADLGRFLVGEEPYYVR